MEDTTLRKELEKMSFNLGASLFGIAEVKPIKKEFHFSNEILEDLDYAISIALRLSDPILDEIKDKPPLELPDRDRPLYKFADEVLPSYMD